MNRKERTYQLRGKQVRLEELTDVAAVRAAEVASPKSAASIAKLVSDAAAEPEVHSFQNAGWEFVPRQEAADGARVYLKPNGRVLLGANRLTVQIPSDRSGEQASDVLSKHGLKVVDQLKFAPNLFVVEAPPESDPVEEATTLMNSGDFQFAEPEFIEVMQGR